VEVSNRPTTGCASLNEQDGAKLRLQPINSVWAKHALTYSITKKKPTFVAITALQD